MTEPKINSCYKCISEGEIDCRCMQINHYSREQVIKLIESFRDHLCADCTERPRGVISDEWIKQNL